MKNVHLIPTDKPSRLLLSGFKTLFLTPPMEFKSSDTYQNIYITSDEEIKEGDWLFSSKTNNIFKADSIEYLESYNMIEDFDKSFYINSKYSKKIILTTDQDLIDDGVQAIDDEFLEWFVKNPSCESVEVKPLLSNNGRALYGYKIIIPKEESKQETFEEAAKKRYIEGVYVINGIDICDASRECFIAGANYQAERMYSEEEVISILYHFHKDDNSRVVFSKEGITKWFEQFKKK
jgi:translation initiation factor 2 beta subunit (eIF-2beta)/eIF-5